MTQTMLEEIRREIQEKVLDKLRLRASASSPVDGSYALAAPSSYLIDLPPGRADQPDPELPAPAVVVTMGKRSQGQEGSSAEILLQAVTYGPGITAPGAAGNQFDPAWEGHWDLINLLDAMAQYILANPVLAGKYEVISPVETQLAQEQPWPYWCGAIRVEVSIPDYHPTIYSDFMT